MANAVAPYLAERPAAGRGPARGTGSVGAAAAASTLRSAQSSRRNRLRRVLHFVIAALLAVLALELVFYLVLAPRLRISTIQVVSDLPVSDSEVLAMADLTGNELFFSLDTDTIGARLQEHPLIREAVVELRFPDTLYLTVSAREPLAVVLTAAETGELVPAVVDESGFVFRDGLPPADPGFDLPLVTGLPAELVRLGDYLPAGVALLLQDLDHLRATRPALSDLISELEVVPTGASGTNPESGGGLAEALAVGAGFDVLLYPIGYTTPLRLGPRLVPHDLAEAFVLLELWRTRAANQELPRLRELDLRAGPPVAVTGSEPANGT
jgi:hypothetical protein